MASAAAPAASGPAVDKAAAAGAKAKAKGVKKSGAAAVVPPLLPDVAATVAEMEQAADFNSAHAYLTSALAALPSAPQLPERLVVLTRFATACGAAKWTADQATAHLFADTAWAGFASPDAPSTTAATELVAAVLRLSNSPASSPAVQRLVQHATSHLLRKQALHVLEALWSGTGSLAIFFDCQLFGSTPVLTLYTGLLSVPRGVETNYRRRSRVAVALLTEHARRLGLSFKKGLPQGETASWDAWTASWVDPLAHTLLHTTMRQRSVIAAHHLPDLFALSRHALPQLLHALSTSASETLRAPAVLTVLRVGKDMGLVVTGGEEPNLGLPADLKSPVSVEVPASLLTLWAEAANAEVQVGTFGLLVSSKTLSAPLLPQERDMIRTYLGSTFVFVSPESRTAVRGYFLHLLDRLRASGHAASRVLTRQNANDQQRSDAQRVVDESHAFLSDLVALVRIHLHTSATHVATTQALGMLRSILTNGLDPAFSVDQAVTKRVDQFPRPVSVADEDMVQRLLELVYSTYDTTISASVELLEKFPRPLPGLTAAESVHDALVRPAKELLLAAREHEAITAAALLQLYQTIYVPLGYAPLELVSSQALGVATVHPSLQPIHALLDFLELRMAAAAPSPEGKGLVGAALSDPLHGTLVSIQRMYGSLSSVQPGLPAAEVRRTNHRVLKDIQRVWDIVAPILTSAAPEGNSGEVDEREAALDAGDDDEDDGLQGQGQRAQAVLHYSWRGIKEASTLLAVVVAATLRADVWTTAELQSVGETFMHWLMHVRHRGAFSTIYPALSRVAIASLRSPVEDQRALPHAWLARFIDTIARPTAGALTITRRSAGLGYSVVALLSACVTARDPTPVGKTVSRLASIAQRDAADPQSEKKTPTIHAFNTLRYMMADRTLSSALRVHLGPLIPLAVDRFRSPLWSVRNAALMLYATLVTRIFTLQVANAHASPLSLTLPDLLGQFPGLDDFIKQELLQGLQGEGEANVRTTPLFAVLLLLAKLRPPPTLHPVGEELLPLLLPQLESPLWQVREQAAWAIVALTPLNGAEGRATTLLDLTERSSNSNALHGAWFTAWILTRAKGASPSLVARADKVQGDDKVHPVVRQVARQVTLSINAPENPEEPEEEREDEGEEEEEDGSTAVLGPLLHSVYLKSQSSSAFSLSPADESCPLPLLIRRADETPCVPEKELILLLLGRRLAEEEVPSHVGIDALQRIYAGTAEEEPVSTRTIALAALTKLPVHLYWGDHVLGLAALLNLLADDELEIRLAAARLAARILVQLRGTRTASPSPWSALSDEGPLLGFSADRGIAMLYAHMQSVGGPTAKAWDSYLIQRILLDKDEWDVQAHRALPVHTSLFAAERPNLHIDRLATLRTNLQAVLHTVLPRLDAERKAAIQAHATDLTERATDFAQRLASAPAAPSTVEAERTLLVADVLAATEVVLALGPNDTLAARANTLRHMLHAPLDTPNLNNALAGASPSQAHRILMVSDFFFPNLGGVEGHIYMVAQALVARGHKVVILTHAYGKRVGVRYLTRGVKVYYVPYAVVARQDALPNFFGLLPLFRSVVLRERIEIVHAHQALSSMGLESLLHAACMGRKTVFTDHSLFGMDNAASILTSKLLRFLLAGVGHAVTVSHVGKENTSLRAQLDPDRVSVIPNAVVASQFLPSPEEREGVTIVVLSRLMYRKGTDLLEAAIPRICAAHKTVRFVIGGDGPNRVGLEQMRERNELQGRVELVGSVPSTDVPSHLQKGDILLNTSLTEAFGTGLVEGAAAGLLVVSTRVGGVEEVLPPDLVLLAEADEDDVVHTALQAIGRIERGEHDPFLAHARIKEMYSWAEVARRLEGVYDRLPAPLERGTLLLRYRAAGHPWIGGVVFVIVAAVDMVLLALLEYFLPAREVDRALDFGP